MMWFPLMQSLINHLNTDQDLMDWVRVTGGSGSTLPEPPSIQVIRDGDTDLEEMGNSSQGKTRLFVECWVRNDDADPFTAYVEIFRLEQLVRASLSAWRKDVSAELGVACKVTIPAIVGDNDSFRPLVGSRFVVDVDWKKSK